MALLHGLLSPLRQTVCLLSPWCSTASPCSKIHLFAFCQKVKNTLWIQHGFYLRGRRNVLPGEEQNPSAWECCWTESWPAFQLCCWRLGTEAALVAPSKVSELLHMAQQPAATLCFPRVQVPVVWGSPGCWVGLKSIHSNKKSYWINRKTVTWIKLTSSKIAPKSGSQHVRGTTPHSLSWKSSDDRGWMSHSSINFNYKEPELLPDSFAHSVSHRESPVRRRAGIIPRN